MFGDWKHLEMGLRGVGCGQSRLGLKARGGERTLGSLGPFVGIEQVYLMAGFGGEDSISLLDTNFKELVRNGVSHFLFLYLIK